MHHRTGQNRQQFGLFAIPLDELIAPDNMVRVVDAFVDAIDLDHLGFIHVKAHKRGAPAYHPGLLLKIYIYGYLNRVRSSRRLELECDGTVLGFYYPLLKGKEKVSGEYCLVFLAYNMRRAISIFEVNGLLQQIKTAFFDILTLRRQVERQNRSLGLESFGVMWRGRVCQGTVASVRA